MKMLLNQKPVIQVVVANPYYDHTLLWNCLFFDFRYFNGKFNFLSCLCLS